MKKRKPADDIRYTKTEAALKEAMIDLLESKSINKISIVELCRNANVNKSTFYLHYNDIFDYYDSLAQSVADEIAGIFTRYSYNTLISEFTTIFIRLINTIKDDRLMQVMLNSTNGDAVLPKITSTVNKAVISENSDAITNQKDFEIKNCFITCGTMGVIQRYSQEVFESPELADSLAHQIQKGFGVAASNIRT